MRKKILFVHHGIGWGGAPKSLITLIENVDYSRFECEVLLIFASDVALKLQEKNITFRIAQSKFYRCFYKCFVHSEAEYISRFNVFRLCEFWILWLFSRFYFAKRELRKCDFDLCHLNSSVLTDWLAPASKIGKVLIHVREPFKCYPIGLRVWVFRHEILRYADSIIAISQDNANRIGLLNKTIVVYNQAKSSAREPSITSYSSKTFLYLGGNLHIKGFIVMVQALQFLNSDIKIWFAGDYSISKKKSVKKFIKSFFKGESYNKDELLLQQLECNPNVSLLGMVGNVSEFMHEACCILVPFTKPHFPRVVIEAYLNYKSVIVSDVDGMTEVVTDNKTGIVVDRDNPEVLAHTINNLACNPNFLHEMGKKGFDFAKSRFTIENIKTIEETYLKVLSAVE